MKAALYHSFGGLEVLEVAEVPEPKMFADQVRIRIKAAALNPANLGFQVGAVDAPSREIGRPWGGDGLAFLGRARRAAPQQKR